MIMNENHVFQDIFKELRLEKDLSQKKIAEELDVSPALVSKWENNMATPHPMMLDYIADYFDVSVDYLIGRSKMRNNPMDKDNLMDKYKALFDCDGVLTEEQKRFIIDYLEERHKQIDEQNNI